MRRRYLLLVVFVFCFTGLTFAQSATPAGTAAPSALDLAAKVVAAAGLVSIAIQGLKRFVPQIKGVGAVILSVIGALAATYATAQTGDVFSIQFLLTTLATALGANGIHSFFRGVQGST